MRISSKWLARYVQFKISPEVLAEKLTSAGLEVEGIERLGEKYEKFVVGEVLSVRKHTNANKLTVCSVDVGSKGGKEESLLPLQIVCGAPNVAAKQKVVVGLVGATVPRNQHDPDGKPFVLSKVNIRGEESFGMICSSYELGLGNDASGIMVLDVSAKVGTPLASFLGMDDVVYEIGVTPNRPDCLCHLGIAREVAASLKKKAVLEKIVLHEDKKSSVKKAISIEVKDSKGCPRYTARLVTNVHVAPSPEWLQSYLKSCGLRPINNVVDVGNFVMYECGQPLHMFDYGKIAGKKIVVRNAAEGEKFRTLDGIDRTLSSDTLMICDAQKPVAIAGVMGGMNSEISDATAAVLIESAYFAPSGIRKTSKHLALQSDAAYRFERGTDPNGTKSAADRAAMLLAEIAGGVVNQGVVDIYPHKIKERVVRVRTTRVNKVLGTDLSSQEMKQLLSPIGITTSPGPKGTFLCTCPTYRPDLEEEIDIVEEIARLHGYSKIEDKMVSAIDFSQHVSRHSEVGTLRASLEGLGFNEIVTNSLLDLELVAPFSSDIVKIKNPISKDLSAMRPNTVFSMLQTVYHNTNLGIGDLKLYELGRTYAKAESGEPASVVKGYREREILSLCMTGRREPTGWHSGAEMVDIYDLKGVVASLLGKILLDKFQFICYDSRSPLTEQTIAIEIDGTYIGFLGKVKAELLKRFSVESDVYVSELSVRDLIQGEAGVKKFVPPSKFPSVKRDLAFILGKDVLMEAVERQIRKSSGALLRDVTLFDIFEGKPLPEGKKSFAFTLDLNSGAKTLTEEEASQVIDAVVKDVCREFNAELRSS